jgi:hypothetical protein
MMRVDAERGGTPAEPRTPTPTGFSSSLPPYTFALRDVNGAYKELRILLHSCSRQLRNDFARYVGKAVHSAVVKVSQLSVVKPEFVQDRGV